MEPVVVAHGLWMPGAETGLLRRRLAAAGFAAHLFKFPTVSAGLDDNVARLAAFVAGLEAPRVHLVGYSLGGVLAVCAARHPGVTGLGRVVCLGSPLNGSVAAARLARLPGGARLLGKSMLELNARAPLETWSGPAELGVIAGRIGVGLGLLLGGFEGPNDGTVRVVETELEGANAHLVAPVSHTTMLFSAAVARQTAAFLRTGHFEPEAGPR